MIAQTKQDDGACSSLHASSRQSWWVCKATRALELFDVGWRQIHFKLLLANAFLGPMPIMVGMRLRPMVYRWIGFKIAKSAGTYIYRNISIEADGEPYSKLTIGQGTRINDKFYLSLNARVTIGERVAIAHQVMIMTTTHELGPPSKRSGKMKALPVTIEDGAWIGARVTILPGVTVGKGSIVATGAVVTKDVPPNTMAAGIPARVVRELPISRPGSEEPWQETK
ncbi:MAG: acyltransferase [Chloroflexi bacterium]|nr:acyltransferase [Chloroflexota bacterium]